MNYVYSVFLVLFLGFVLSACDSLESPNSSAMLPDNDPVNHLLSQGDPDAALPLIERCKSCHGIYGEKSFDGSPFLAGQGEAYLVTAMMEYVDGQRQHEAMTQMLSSFSSKNIQDIAAYFSRSDATWRPTKIGKTATQKAKRIVADLSRQGKIIPCASCHGKDGNSSNPDAPNLALLEPAYMEVALRGYLNGERLDPFMTNFKLVLSGVDITSLSQYFADNKPKKSRVSNRGNAKKGQIASQKCVGCHGRKGNSFVATFPSLAGQHSRYLVTAMQAYKKGTRRNKVMRELMQNMSKKTMDDIAAYYAIQTPTKGSKRPNTKFMPLFEGAEIAAVCDSCHGKNGNSVEAGIPSLTGLHPDYLQAAVNSYKSGDRQHVLMKALVSYLSDVDVEKVAFYYATQARLRNAFQWKGDESEARKFVGSCNACHGTNGNSQKTKIPSLAGQDPQYLASAINAYRSGIRHNEDMKNAVKALSEADIQNVTAYYAIQIPEKVADRKMLPPKKLAKKCDHCHGENGFSDDVSIPRLAGQVPEYINQALRDYKSEKRQHSIMGKMADVLSLTEIDAIAKYYYLKGKNK